MSTNTNNNGLYNIDDLQHIANELFKTLPNEFPKEISLSPDLNDHPKATKVVETLLSAGNLADFTPNTSLQNPTTAYPSHSPVSGFGGSSSVGNYANTGVTSLYPNTDLGTAYPNDKDFNINNPITGFNDVNLKNGRRP